MDRNTYLLRFMRMRILLCLSVASAFFGCASIAAPAGEKFDEKFENAVRYDYRAGSSKESSLAMIWVSAKGDSEPLLLRFPGHSNAYKIAGCKGGWHTESKPERFHFCLVTSYHTIVLPNDIGPKKGAWTFDRTVFKLLASQQNFVIGERHFEDVFIIETPPQASRIMRYHNRRMVSYYSKRFGLLAFQMQNIDNNDKGPLWVLDGDIGVGAMPVPDRQP